MLGICGGAGALGYSPHACDGKQEVQRPQALLCARSCPAAPFAHSREGKFQHLSQKHCSSAPGEEGRWRGLLCKPIENATEESSFIPCLAFK